MILFFSFGYWAKKLSWSSEGFGKSTYLVTWRYVYPNVFSVQFLASQFIFLYSIYTSIHFLIGILYLNSSSYKNLNFINYRAIIENISLTLCKFLINFTSFHHKNRTSNQFCHIEPFWSHLNHSWMFTRTLSRMMRHLVSGKNIECSNWRFTYMVKQWYRFWDHLCSKYRINIKSVQLLKEDRRCFLSEEWRIFMERELLFSSEGTEPRTEELSFWPKSGRPYSMHALLRFSNHI